MAKPIVVEVEEEWRRATNILNAAYNPGEESEFLGDRSTARGGIAPAKEAVVLHKYGCGLALLIAAASLETLGCGSSSTSNRMLQAVSVTPSQADAQSYPNGQVQFTATGTFSKPPSPSVVTFQDPYSGSWFSTDPVTLVSTGKGTAIFQCIAGKSGTFTIIAAASNGIGGTAATAAMVRGQAKLTCP